MKKRKIWLVVIPVILFVFLAVGIDAGITNGFEGWAYNETMEEMSPAITGIMKVVTHFGDSTTVIAFCLLLIILPKPRRTIALPVSVSVIISFVLNVALKNLFTRERPDILRMVNESSYSFPSGHAMINASLYTILIILIFKFIKNTPVKLILSSLCVFLTIVIGYSRVYLGVHYAGDILGGWIIGFTVSVIVYFIWNAKVYKKMNPRKM